ncbi:MAG: hypothetical protein L6407_03500 [Candidatus Delongbacteria bacterium]|nr:hypothetical protein [Candidatus Delongbacteria bacterium]
MKKEIATTLLIAMLTVVFAMSGDGRNVPVDQKKETIKDINQESHQNIKPVPLGEENNSFDYEKNLKENEEQMWAELELFNLKDTPKYEQLDSHYQGYKDKFKELGLKSIHRIPWLYKSRINLDAINDLKKIGIDIYELDRNNFSGRHGLDLKSTILFSQVIVSGTIVDSLNYPDSDKPAHNCYIVKIDRLIKGEGYFSKIPEFIKIYTVFGKHYSQDGNLVSEPFDQTGYRINKSYVFILSKDNDMLYIRQNIQKSKTNNDDKGYRYWIDFLEPNVFTQVPAKNINMLNEIENISMEIDKVNDLKSFYKRGE